MSFILFMVRFCSGDRELTMKDMKSMKGFAAGPWGQGFKVVVTVRDRVTLARRASEGFAVSLACASG